MADFNSALPIRTELVGQSVYQDVIIKLGDATNPTTQQAAVDTFGSQFSVLRDISGNAIGDQLLSASYWLQVVDPTNGPAAAGTAASYSSLVGGIYNSGGETLTSGQQSSLQLNASGYLLIASTPASLGYDTNYGTVGANTLRTASQIGNATGAANFNYGTVGAQTLRTASQIGNATGSADFGAGTTSAQTLRVAANTYDGSGNAISSTGGALNVSAAQSGTWTVQQGTPPWSFIGTLTNNNAAPAANNIGALAALAEGTINASRYTSGDQVLLVTDLAGNTNVDLQYYLGAAVSKTNPIATTISDGTNVITAAISAYGTAPTGTEVMGVNAYITNTVPVTLPYDENWGVVGASTLRTAAQIGNATGAADFNNGATGAQTLRVAANLAVSGANVTTANPVPVTVVSSTPGTNVQDYHTSASLAAGASVTFTYTVPAGKTFSLERAWSSASGKIKTVLQNNGSTIMVGFNSTATPNIDMTIVAPPSIATGNTATVTITNNDLLAFDVYATIEGNLN
jgi:hypothetical protein